MNILCHLVRHRIVWLVVAVLLVDVPVCGQTTVDLPAGNYLYMGTKARRTPPRGVIIDSTGHIEWQEVGNLATEDQASNSEKATRGDKKSDKTFFGVPRKKTKSDVTQLSEVAWDSYRYPVIKWKVHPITTIPGGIAQLSTTIDPTGKFGGPVLRFQLKLFKIERVPQMTTVELLDVNGFKLIEFHIAGSQFHPIPGTGVVEASDTADFGRIDLRSGIADSGSMDSYKRVAEYTVNCQ